MEDEVILLVNRKDRLILRSLLSHLIFIKDRPVFVHHSKYTIVSRVSLLILLLSCPCSNINTLCVFDYHLLYRRQHKKLALKSQLNLVDSLGLRLFIVYPVLSLISLFLGWRFVITLFIDMSLTRQGTSRSLRTRYRSFTNSEISVQSPDHP